MKKSFQPTISEEDSKKIKAIQEQHFNTVTKVAQASQMETKASQSDIALSVGKINTIETIINDK